MEQDDGGLGDIARKKGQEWKPIFEPQIYWDESSNRTLAQSTLSKRQLKTYGRRLTQIREHFNEEALQAKLFAEPIGHQGGQTAVQKDIGELLVGTSQDHITKVQDSLDAFAFAASRSSTNEFIEPTTAACRNKAKNREKLARTCTWQRQLPPGSPEGEQRH